jgi:hypothetical protein
VARKSILQRVAKEHPKDKFLGACQACNTDLKAGKSDLEKHAATAKHKKNVGMMKGLQSVQTFFKKSTMHDRKVSEAETKLANFFAQHNVAFQIVQHLVPLLKDCLPDSSILTDVQLGRTKTVNIIKNVIGKKLQLI